MPGPHLPDVSDVSDEELTRAFLVAVDEHARRHPRPSIWREAPFCRKPWGCDLCTARLHVNAINNGAMNRDRASWSLREPYGPRWRRFVKRALREAVRERLLGKLDKRPY